jgi:acetylornithine deacetylase/succinyl-diaminopimelate desuccinylase-like protein
MRALIPALAAALLGGHLPASAQAPVSPDRYQALSKEVLKEMVEFNTAHGHGGTVALVRAAEQRLLRAGFAPADIFVGGALPEEVNLVARLRGRIPTLKPLLLLAHIDVVEALKEDWSDGLDPFVFTERDGFFYGRGVMDDKDESSIHLVNLIRMKEEGFVPDRDIVVALTTDEEGGGHNGVAWLIANHRPLIDAELALNEGGGGQERDGRKLSNSVQATEKKSSNFRFEATNSGGHSSVPREDNAIYDLSRALLAVGGHRFPVMLNPITEAFFTETGKVLGGELGDAMLRLVANPGDAAALAVLERDPYYDARLRTKCVPTILEGGHANNALPQRATANVNCRILQDHDPAAVLATLRELAGPGVAVTGGNATASPDSPLTEDVMGPIRELTRGFWGVPVIPMMSTGATDGSSLRRAGIPVYGVSGVFDDVEDTRTHGRNERIREASYFEAQEFLYRLAKALSRAPQS